MYVVDAHHHLWDPQARGYPFLAEPGMERVRRPYGLDDLRRRCRAHGVSRTVLVQTVPSVDETREFLRVAQQSEGLIGGVVGWVDLQGPGVRDTVDSLRSGPGGRFLVGVRHQAQNEPDEEWLVRPRVLDGLRAVADAGLCFDLLVTPTQLASAVAAARAVAHGSFVLDHIGKPSLDGADHEAWTAGIRDLADLPNVTCKLSGLVSLGVGRAATADELRPFTDRVLELFGPARLMAGSDWPICEAVAGYGDVFALADRLSVGLAESERRRLFGETACEVYGLGASDFSDGASDPSDEEVSMSRSHCSTPLM